MGTLTLGEDGVYSPSSSSGASSGTVPPASDAAKGTWRSRASEMWQKATEQHPNSSWSRFNPEEVDLTPKAAAEPAPKSAWRNRASEMWSKATEQHPNSSWSRFNPEEVDLTPKPKAEAPVKPSSKPVYGSWSERFKDFGTQMEQGWSHAHFRGEGGAHILQEGGSTINRAVGRGVGVLAGAPVAAFRGGANVAMGVAVPVAKMAGVGLLGGVALLGGAALLSRNEFNR